MQMLYRLSYEGRCTNKIGYNRQLLRFFTNTMERETGFEPATLSLEG